MNLDDILYTIQLYLIGIEIILFVCLLFCFGVYLIYGDDDNEK